MTTHAEPEERGLGNRIVGGSVDPVLRPVFGVSLLQSIAESAQASFLGLWALRALGSSQRELGLAFAGAAIAAVVMGNVGGRLSDRIGRRRPILLASATLAIFGGCLGFVGGHVWLGLALIVGLGGATGAVFAAQQALITDLVPRDRHEHAFASQRVVQNIGFIGGPLIGAALLTVSWRTLFVGIGALGALAFVVALQAVPHDRPSEPDPDTSTSTLRVLLRDPAFAVLLGAGTLAAMTYVSYETLLPISLVQSHGVAPAAWGILLSINPILVVLFQMRLTARLGGTGEFARLAVGVAAMATPFLLLSVSAALPLLILMLVLFVLGEMLGVPPSQGLIARLAPEEKRGAYLGASGATWPAAFALGPLVGLQVRGALGDSAMWCAVAIIGGLAIVLYAIAERISGRGTESSRRPVPPSA
jgi:predicted MFS family arabinose efflux permease